MAQGTNGANEDRTTSSPLLPRAGGTGSLAGDQRDASGSRFCVLVVEDDKFQRDTLRDMLESIASSSAAAHAEIGSDFEMTVECCGSGEGGWDLLQEKHFDLALVDIVLPGVSGLDLSWCFQQHSLHESLSDARRPATVMVACTTEVEQVRPKLKTHGLNDLIAKPVAMADLRHLVRREGRPHTPETLYY